MMDAVKFLALLRASNPTWHECASNPPRWVFRGHRNAHWRLKPRAWRTALEDNPLRALIDKLAKVRIDTDSGVELGSPLHQALAWTYAEKFTINEFRRIGWHMGFGVDEPINCYSMDVIVDTRQPGIFSPFQFCKDIGLAQHYGVPTRFLDWTFNPIFAIFFAQDVDVRDPERTDLCVWALNINAITMVRHKEGSESRCLMRSITPPRRDNEFILAQDGLLLEIEHRWALSFFQQNGTWPSVEEVVVALNHEPEFYDDDPDASIYDGEHPMLRRIVLPAREIPHLRLLLKREGITREKLMPTLENAAKAAIRAVSEV